MVEVVALGEMLIDFVQYGTSDKGCRLFEENPGGAPANVLALLQRLGHKTAMLSKVGKDAFGDLLEQTVEEIGVETRGILRDDKVNTTLAFVHTFADGDRDFSFYRKPGADIMLREDEIDYSLLDECKIFHFGTLSMTDEPIKTATKAALEYVKKQGKIISFDPNYRAFLWDNEEEAKEAIWFGLEQCDILKIADNEITWLTGRDDYDEGVAEIRKHCKAKIINVTLGKEGVYGYYDGGARISVPAYVNEHTVDTTGAGDCFCGCVLSYVLEHGMELTDGQRQEMLEQANAAASIVVTKKGAIPSMPTREEIMARRQQG